MDGTLTSILAPPPFAHSYLPFLDDAEHEQTSTLTFSLATLSSVVIVVYRIHEVGREWVVKEDGVKCFASAKFRYIASPVMH